MIRENNIVFLIGAGCSVEAGIPASERMVKDIENLLQTNSDWAGFQKLYNYLKSCIIFGEGINGNHNSNFNVEQLLITIIEIEKKEKNIIFPFIGNWHSLLVELAGRDFEKLTAFKKLIVERLRTWVAPRHYDNANYYEGFAKFKNEIGNALRVFTLNYDLCFEKIVGNFQQGGSKLVIEDGFNLTNHEWEYNNFEMSTDKDFFLYKLHGSIDWYKDKEDPEKLKKSENPEDDPELIFGIQAKLQSEDPYLFYTSQFRQYLLQTELKLFVTIGYSFADDYLNRIIRKGIATNESLNLLVVTYIGESELEQEKKRILKELNLKEELSNRIHLYTKGAGHFLHNALNQEYLNQNYIKDDETIFDQ